MALGEVRVEIDDALVARLSSCTASDDGIGLRGGGTHGHFDGSDVSIFQVCRRRVG